MNPLHYVDVPKGETTYDRERDCPNIAYLFLRNVLANTTAPEVSILAVCFNPAHVEVKVKAI
jgi:hypothetical protein